MTDHDQPEDLQKAMWGTGNTGQYTGQNSSGVKNTSLEDDEAEKKKKAKEDRERTKQVTPASTGLSQEDWRQVDQVATETQNALHEAKGNTGEIKEAYRHSGSKLTPQQNEAMHNSYRNEFKTAEAGKPEEEIAKDRAEVKPPIPDDVNHGSSDYKPFSAEISENDIDRYDRRHEETIPATTIDEMLSSEKRAYEERRRREIEEGRKDVVEGKSPLTEGAGTEKKESVIEDRTGTSPDMKDPDLMYRHMEKVGSAIAQAAAEMGGQMVSRGWDLAGDIVRMTFTQPHAMSSTSRMIGTAMGSLEMAGDFADRAAQKYGINLQQDPELMKDTIKYKLYKREAQQANGVVGNTFRAIAGSLDKMGVQDISQMTPDQLSQHVADMRQEAARLSNIIAQDKANTQLGKRQNRLSSQDRALVYAQAKHLQSYMDQLSKQGATMAADQRAMARQQRQASRQQRLQAQSTLANGQANPYQQILQWADPNANWEIDGTTGMPTKAGTYNIMLRTLRDKRAQEIRASGGLSPERQKWYDDMDAKLMEHKNLVDNEARRAPLRPYGNVFVGISDYAPGIRSHLPRILKHGDWSSLQFTRNIRGYLAGIVGRGGSSPEYRHARALLLSLDLSTKTRALRTSIGTIDPRAMERARLFHDKEGDPYRGHPFDAVEAEYDEAELGKAYEKFNSMIPKDVNGAQRFNPEDPAFRQALNEYQTKMREYKDKWFPLRDKSKDDDSVDNEDIDTGKGAGGSPKRVRTGGKKKAATKVDPGAVPKIDPTDPMKPVDPDKPLTKREQQKAVAETHRKARNNLKSILLLKEQRNKKSGVIQQPLSRDERVKQIGALIGDDLLKGVNEWGRFTDEGEFQTAYGAFKDYLNRTYPGMRTDGLETDFVAAFAPNDERDKNDALRSANAEWFKRYFKDNGIELGDDGRFKSVEDYKRARNLLINEYGASKKTKIKEGLKQFIPVAKPAPQPQTTGTEVPQGPEVNDNEFGFSIKDYMGNDTAPDQTDMDIVNGWLEQASSEDPAVRREGVEALMSHVASDNPELLRKLSMEALKLGSEQGYLALGKSFIGTDPRRAAALFEAGAMVGTGGGSHNTAAYTMLKNAMTRDLGMSEEDFKKWYAQERAKYNMGHSTVQDQADRNARLYEDFLGENGVFSENFRGSWEPQTPVAEEGTGEPEDEKAQYIKDHLDEGISTVRMAPEDMKETIEGFKDPETAKGYERELEDIADEFGMESITPETIGDAWSSNSLYGWDKEGKNLFRAMEILMSKAYAEGGEAAYQEVLNRMGASIAGARFDEDRIRSGWAGLDDGEIKSRRDAKVSEIYNNRNKRMLLRAWERGDRAAILNNPSVLERYGLEIQGDQLVPKTAQPVSQPQPTEAEVPKEPGEVIDGANPDAEVTDDTDTEDKSPDQDTSGTDTDVEYKHGLKLSMFRPLTGDIDERRRALIEGDLEQLDDPDFDTRNKAYERIVANAQSMSSENYHDFIKEMAEGDLPSAWFDVANSVAFQDPEVSFMADMAGILSEKLHLNSFDRAILDNAVQDAVNIGMPEDQAKRLAGEALLTLNSGDENAVRALYGKYKGSVLDAIKDAQIGPEQDVEEEAVGGSTGNETPKKQIEMTADQAKYKKDLANDLGIEEKDVDEQLDLLLYSAGLAPNCRPGSKATYDKILKAVKAYNRYGDISNKEIRSEKEKALATEIQDYIKGYPSLVQVFPSLKGVMSEIDKKTKNRLANRITHFNKTTHDIDIDKEIRDKFGVNPKKDEEFKEQFDDELFHAYPPSSGNKTSPEYDKFQKYMSDYIRNNNHKSGRDSYAEVIRDYVMSPEGLNGKWPSYKTRNHKAYMPRYDGVPKRENYQNMSKYTSDVQKYVQYWDAISKNLGLDEDYSHVEEFKELNDALKDIFASIEAGVKNPNYDDKVKNNLKRLGADLSSKWGQIQSNMIPRDDDRFDAVYHGEHSLDTETKNNLGGQINKDISPEAQQALDEKEEARLAAEAEEQARREEAGNRKYNTSEDYDAAIESYKGLIENLKDSSELATISQEIQAAIEEAQHNPTLEHVEQGAIITKLNKLLSEISNSKDIAVQLKDFVNGLGSDYEQDYDEGKFDQMLALVEKNIALTPEEKEDLLGRASLFREKNSISRKMSEMALDTTYGSLSMSDYEDIKRRLIDLGDDEDAQNMLQKLERLKVRSDRAGADKNRTMNDVADELKGQFKGASEEDDVDLSGEKELSDEWTLDDADYERVKQIYSDTFGEDEPDNGEEPEWDQLVDKIYESAESFSTEFGIGEMINDLIELMEIYNLDAREQDRLMKRVDSIPTMGENQDLYNAYRSENGGPGKDVEPKSFRDIMRERNPDWE